MCPFPTGNYFQAANLQFFWDFAILSPKKEDKNYVSLNVTNMMFQ